MRSVVVTAVLLLVVLMSMSASAAWTPEYMCRTKYPANNCTTDLGPGWNLFAEDRCVKAFVGPYFSHENAMRHCNTFKNGDLVSIHSVKELEQVECAMYRVFPGNAHYWIGMFRSHKGLVWSDGSKVDYYNWAGYQPDSDWWNQEHCIEMNWGPDWGPWNDGKCVTRKPFVCQVKLE